LNVASAFYGVDVEALKSTSRQAPTVKARNMTMYALRTFSDLSFAAIGGVVSRDASTAVHGIRKVEDLISTDRGTAEDFAEIEHRLRDADAWSRLVTSSTTPDGSEDLGVGLFNAKAKELVRQGSDSVIVGDFSLAIGYFEKAVVVLDQQGLVPTLAEAYLGLARCARLMNETEKAREHILRAWTVGRALFDFEVLGRALYEWDGLNDAQGHLIDRAIGLLVEVFRSASPAARRVRALDVLESAVFTSSLLRPNTQQGRQEERTTS
jgi:tetratricopeptide (TPR) repeat protein